MLSDYVKNQPPGWFTSYRNRDLLFTMINDFSRGIIYKIARVFMLIII